MKKSLILVGMLAIGYANAQEGVVGINTDEPKATLQVTPSAENAKATATTNEGIMAPQLSKSRVAGIATPVEGTLVYVTDETTSPISAYTGADAKVAKITEKGYYFYNGTEWVKAGADISSQVWKYDGAKAYINEAIKDKVEYLKNGGYRHFPREMRPITSSANGVMQDIALDVDGASIYNWKVSFSDLIGGTGSHKSLNENLLVVDENENSPHGNYFSNFIKIQTNQKTTRDISALYSTIGYANHHGSGNVGGISGGNFGGYIFNGSANEVIGATNGAGLITTGNVIVAIGAKNAVSLRSSGNVVEAVGSKNEFRIDKSPGRDFKSTVNNAYLTYNAADLTSDSISGGVIENMMGTYTNIIVPLNKAIKVNNLYGLYINDIHNATEKNYAIYSNAGKVRVGDLADTSVTVDRAVVVDKDGVLKVGAATATNGVQNTSNMKCEEATRGVMNFVKDVTIGSGTGDAFAVCLKGTDGKFYWRYLYGAGGVSNLEGNFGTGLE